MTRLLHRLFGRLPVGWLQLAHSHSRLATAISGVAFANVLVFVQLGLANALSGTITRGYALFSADILVSASDGHTLSDGSHVARAHLLQAMADRDVVGGAELYIGTVNWSRTSGDTALQTFGINPVNTNFMAPEIGSVLTSLKIADRAAIDRSTRRLEKELVANLSESSPLSFEYSNRTISIVDVFNGGVGFSADGYLLVSDQTFLSLFPRRDSGAPNHLLIKTTRDASAEVVAERLQERFGSNVRVRTMKQAIASDLRYQGTQRPTGIIFGFGVVIGILVGIVIVYQVLSTDVADHLREYATFKAIGYSQNYFTGIILEEATILASLGFVPGLIIALVLYWALNLATGLPLIMTLPTAMYVLLGTIAACALSGLLASRRLASADPAELF